MSIKENDPDTLQILDEIDEEWVKLWLKATGKKTDKKIEFATIAYQEELLYSWNLRKKPIFYWNDSKIASQGTSKKHQMNRIKSFSANTSSSKFYVVNTRFSFQI